MYPVFAGLSCISCLPSVDVVRLTIESLECPARRGSLVGVPDPIHQGHAQVTDTDVHLLATFVMGLLLGLLPRRDEFSTTRELENWVDGRRLAC
jgi:hypothetical protein